MTTTEGSDLAVKEMVLSEWVWALESGQYQQGMARLAYSDPEMGMRYCCLGVLCLIGEQHGLVESLDDGYFRTTDLIPVREGETLDDHTDTELPNRFAQWLRIDENPWLDGEPAIRRNDDEQESFLQIAEAARAEFHIDR
jgi:hypothetical protein